jgi:dienelactone hydrolase
MNKRHAITALLALMLFIRDLRAENASLAPGWHAIQFSNLPTPAKKPAWFDYGFDAAQEKFQIYVPRGLDSRTPCGVLAWTNPNDTADIPKQFEPLFDQFRLIAVAAEKCGNDQASQRRVGLLVSAILQLAKMTPLDGRRIVISGLSGGGRLAATAAFVHPEIFRGAISWCGGNFYRDWPDSTKPNRWTYGIANAHHIPNAVTAQNVIDARRNVRFVLITGKKDFTFTDSHDIANELRKENFAVQLIDEPNLGHAVGSAASMKRALEFTLGPAPAR